MDKSGHIFADFMRASGKLVVEVDGVYWYEYSGFITPAYLPHCTPPISQYNATKACEMSKRAFARWTSFYGVPVDSEWWYIIRDGHYRLSDCSANTRSKVRRGKKKLFAARLAHEEVMAKGYSVCKRAVARYNDESFLPTEEAFKRRISASIQVPGVMEYCGVFYGDNLVALAENLVQTDEVFWETIWYDPAFLGFYSSYVLTDYMLDYYLNERKFLCVSDGSRSIYHDTSVQDFYIDKFGFKKKYGVLNIQYRAFWRIAVEIVYRTWPLFFYFNRYNRWRFFRIMNGLFTQEQIRRSFFNRQDLQEVVPLTTRLGGSTIESSPKSLQEAESGHSDG